MTEPRMPMAATISAALFSIGISLAATAPYDSVVAIDALRISHGDYALILSVAALVGVTASVTLGWLSDRIGDRRVLVLAAAGTGALGFGLVYLLRSPMAFALAYCLILPFGNTAFGQTFAYARVYYDRRRPGDAEFRITALRSIYAAAWVLVPPLAGWIAAAYQVFDVYLLAALAYLGCGAIALVLLSDPGARIVAPVAGVGSAAAPASGIATPMLVGIGGVLLINVAIKLSSTTLPLAVIGNFGGTIGDVGIAAGIRAFLEIPLMLGWGLLGRRVRKPMLIAAGGLIYALFLALLTQARGVGDVFWLQVPCAMAISVLMSVPISYMQEAIRGRVGLSTALLDVTVVVAGLLSAGLFGLIAAPERYLDLFWVASGLGALGALVLILAHGVLERTLSGPKNALGKPGRAG